MDGRRCSSDRQIIYPFEQSEFLPTIKWAAEMPPFFNVCMIRLCAKEMPQSV